MVMLYMGSFQPLTGKITESHISDLLNYLTDEFALVIVLSPAVGIDGDIY